MHRMKYVLQAILSESYDSRSEQFGSKDDSLFHDPVDLMIQLQLESHISPSIDLRRGETC